MQWVSIQKVDSSRKEVCRMKVWVDPELSVGSCVVSKGLRNKWHTTSYWFQVSILVIWCMYTTWNAPQDKPSYHLSSYKIITRCYWWYFLCFVLHLHVFFILSLEVCDLLSPFTYFAEKEDYQNWTQMIRHAKEICFKRTSMWEGLLNKKQVIEEYPQNKSVLLDRLVALS